MLTALEPWQWKSAIRDNLMDRRDPRPLRWKDPKIEFRGRTTPLSAAVRTLIREEGKGLALYFAICSETAFGCGPRVLPKLHRAIIRASDIPYIDRAFQTLYANLFAEYFRPGKKDLSKREPELLLRTHDPHFDPAHEGVVAFYASEAALLEGKRTFMRPGRYLEKYWGPSGRCPYLSPVEVIDMTRAFTDTFTSPELKFVSDPDGWEYVYEHGPKSCMKYNREGRYLHDDLYGKNHPVRLYAHPDSDIALAYIEKGGQIVARSIVNKEATSFLRVYAHDGVARRDMERLLKQAGYGQDSGCLKGQPLVLRWYDEEQLIVPWLDGAYQYVRVEEDRLVISDDGYEAQSSSGLLEIQERVWAYIDETENQALFVECDVTEVYGEYYTETALRCRGFVQCDRCGSWGLPEVQVQYRGAPVCRDHTVVCEYTGDTILRVNSTPTLYDGLCVSDEVVVPIYVGGVGCAGYGVHSRCYTFEGMWFGNTHVHFRTLQEMTAHEFVENFKVVDGELRRSLVTGEGSTNPEPGESYTNVVEGSECPPLREVLAAMWARSEGTTPITEPQGVAA